MKASLLGLLILVFTTLSFAQNVAPGGSISAPAPVVAASPSPSPTPAVVAPADVKVEVAEPAAPPKWAEQLIVSAQALPVIGPIVTKALVYAGIISSILTGLIAFLLAALSALSGAFNIAGLASLAEKITLFKNGKIMYYLAYLSMFNAKKPDSLVKPEEKKAA